MSELVVRRTLAKRLTRTILTLAVPLFILALGVFYQHARTLLHKEAIEREHTILSTTEQLVENYLTAIETAAHSNVWMLEENFTPDSIPTLAHRLVRLNGSVLSCSVATEPDVFPGYSRFSVYSVHDGDTIITALEPEFEYFQKNWYKKPMQTGRPCWINPFSDFNEGVINHHDAVGSYCIPLRPHGNRIEGVLSVDFSFQVLRQTILATHHPYPSSYFMLLGPVGGYLIHPESSLLFKKTIFTATDSVEHPDIIALGREMTSGKYGSMHADIDGVHCHVTYMPVYNTGWSLALVCHDDDVLADYNHLTILMIVFVFIGMLFIAWITQRVVQRNIQPLNELMDVTKKVADGQFHAEIPPTDHKDVIGKLQNAFRNMQQAIVTKLSEMKFTEIEINEGNAELERVLPLAREASMRKQVFLQKVWNQISMPLNIIGGLTQVLQDHFAARDKSLSAKEPLQSEEMTNITKTMKHHAVHLHRMALMLYDSSETSADDDSRYKRKDRISCNEMARHCISITEKQGIASNISFDTELPDDCYLTTNSHYLEYTIRELLYNSAKFSDAQHISLWLTQTDTHVCFVVEDIGPGLPEKSEEMIFVPFTKVNDLSEGLGLGLPLCKSHIEKLGGYVTYDATYKEGCRIVIELPKE